MRIVRLACVLAVTRLTGQLLGQTLAPPVPPDTGGAHAITLLDSASFSDRAPGAYLAANHHLQACMEKLLDLLHAATPLRTATVDSADYAYVQSLLNALIQLDARVNQDDVLPFSSTWPTEAIILLARNAKANEAAYKEWLAVSNLLLGSRFGCSQA